MHQMLQIGSTMGDPGMASEPPTMTFWQLFSATLGAGWNAYCPGTSGKQEDVSRRQYSGI